MKTLSIGDGLAYPWGKPGRLWNILWILVPIYGWFAFYGYGLKIVRSLVGGDFNALPAFGSSVENFKQGFWLFVKWLPLTIIIILIGIIPKIGVITQLLIEFLLVPYLFMNLCMKKTVASTFALDKAFKALGKDFVAYLVVVLKSLLYFIIYILASIILIGIPCFSLGGFVFYAHWFKQVYEK